MAESRDDSGSELDNECPFRVKVPDQGSYWLFDLPDDRSRIVRNYTKCLAESYDPVLAKSDCIMMLVNRTASVMQTCRKTDAIRLDSQCNRLIKCIEATAVYLCNFEGLAMHVTKQLHDAMKCLYGDYRPPRNVEARLTLNAIADMTTVVLQVIERQLSLVTKLSRVTYEGFTVFLEAENVTTPSITGILTNFVENAANVQPDDPETLAMFNEVVQKLLQFWDKLAKCFRSVATMTNEIKERTPQTKDEDFNEFKTKIIKISANWIALRKVCSKHINHISPSNFRKDAEDTLPQCFDDLSTHFKNIDVHLLVDSDYDLEMAANIVIYSSWVQPKLDTTVYQCSKLTEEAKELVSCFDSTNASKTLVEIEQQSQHVAIMTRIYLNRLRVIESYAEQQQENMMKKTLKLELEMNEKQKNLEEKKKEISEAKWQLSDYEAKKESAEKQKKDAERKRNAYAASLRKLSKKSLRYLCTRVLLRSCNEQAQEEKKNTRTNEVKCKELRGIIKKAESRRQRLNKEVARLSKEVQILKQKCDYSIERLQEMKKAIADLKKSICSWDEFLVNIEHGENRAKFMQRLLRTANKQKDTKRVLGSRGMKTALSKFIDAYTVVEHLFAEQWQHIICYDYKCDVCQQKRKGLPLPVDDNTVVCCSCAQTFVD
jgi:DNA repair exonuclease SbcCD ATPase subunit